MTRRWYYPLIPLALVFGFLATGCGSPSGGAPNTGSTGTHSSAPASSSAPSTAGSAQPAAHTSSADPLLAISKLCLVTMPQVQTLSPTIFNLATRPTDQPSTSGVDSCQYGGKATAGGLLTKFLSITVLSTWSGMTHHFATRSGFSNGSAGVVSVNGTSLVIAGAQITSGSQNGSWLVLTVGNNGPALVTWQALKATLDEAEHQYVATSNATANPNPSPSPSMSGGNSSAANDVACKLISTSMISATFPPPDSNGLKAIEMGHGPLKSQVANATDYICGYDFWVGNVVNQAGSPDGYVLVTLSCGPGAGQDATLTDDVSSSTFTSGGMTAAVGVTRGGGSVGTGSQTVQQVLTSAATVAQRMNACG